MKGIILTIGLLLVGNVLLAQSNENVPYIREGVEWGYVQSLSGPATDFSPKYTYYRGQFKGSQVIESLTYVKFYIYETENLDENSYQVVYMRQDGGAIYTRMGVYQSWLENYIHGYIQRNREYDHLVYRPESDQIRVSDASASAGGLWAFVRDGDVTLLDGTKRARYVCTDDTSKVFVEGFGYADVELGGSTPEGIIPFPGLWQNVPDMYTNYRGVMYERNVATGEIVYKSPLFDKYAAGDPTLSAVEKVGCDAVALSVSGRTVSAEGVVIEAYGIDGRLVAKGTGELTLPAAGVYILRVPGRTPAKVIVR